MGFAVAAFLLATTPARVRLAASPRLMTDSPESGVRVILGLCNQGDWERLERYMGLPLKDGFKASHFGLALVSLGKATWEPLLPGMVVPFEVPPEVG